MVGATDPPTIPEGYGVTIAYNALLDATRSLSIAILGAEGESSHYEATDEKQSLDRAMVNASWTGLLTALSLLLEARYLPHYQLIIN